MPQDALFSPWPLGIWGKEWLDFLFIILFIIDTYYELVNNRPRAPHYSFMDYRGGL